jgi:hypothetical protein
MTSMTGATGFNAGPRQSKPISMKPKGYRQYSQYTPEQHQISAQRQQLSGPDSYLAKLAGGDEEAFNQIEAPAMRQFQGLQGQIASRFSGLGGQGSLGSRKSSGFQNTINQAGSDFLQDLASKRHTMRSDAIKGLHDMYGDLVSERPYELYEKQNKPKTWQNIVGAAAPIVGAAGGFTMGGPMGAYAGYQAGNALGGAVRGS